MSGVGLPRQNPRRVLRGSGRLLDIPHGSLVEPLLNRKYGMTRRLLGLFNLLVRAITRKQPEPSAYVEIVDA